MSYAAVSGTDQARRRWAMPVVCSLVLAFAAVSNPRAADTLHEPFDGLLQAHVTDGQVDYPGIANDRRLGKYLDTLAATDPGTLSREDQLVYWINAYNAFAIKGILDGSSPSSFFGRIGYFKSDKYNAGGMEINLYDLERDILIPMREPRIHFAINCASLSCPKLLSEAYTKAELESQLDAQAREFINDQTKNRFDREAKVAHLSKIFDWFDEDFVIHSGSVLAYVAQYVDDPALAAELQSGAYAIKYLEYDWSLNGIPPST